MERTLNIVDQALGATGKTVTIPCDAQGNPARVSTAEPRINPVEIVATVLLALAAVATAWSGYQASRWNGEQAKAFSRGNAARIESARASGLADTQTEIDVATFTQWVNAYARQDESSPTSTPTLPGGVQAGRRCLDRDPTAQEPLTPL